MGHAKPSWGTAAFGIAAAVGTAWGLVSLANLLVPLREDLLPEDLAIPGTRYLEFGDERVAYVDQGQGEPTILLIHGFADGSGTWSHIQPTLAKSHRVVSFDLLGFGASTRPPTLSPADWHAQVFAVMDALGIADAVIVGNSLGSHIGFACADQAPERVRGICVVGGLGMRMPQVFPLLRAISQTPFAETLLRSLRRSKKAVRPFVREAYSEGYPVTDEMLRYTQRVLSVRGTASSLRHLGHTYSQADLPDVLARVQCPVLLIWGTDDRLVPAPGAIRVADALAHAEVILVPRCGHMVHIERPQTVVAHLERFMACL